MRTVLYKNLPPARHNKNAVFQVSDRDGQMYRSDGEFWAPITEQLTQGAQVVEAVTSVNGGLEFQAGSALLNPYSNGRAISAGGGLSAILVGDSITAANGGAGPYADSNNTNFVGYFTQYQIVAGQPFTSVWNAGKGEDTTAAIVARLAADVLPYRADYGFLLAGTNDFGLGGFTLEQTKANYLTIVSALRSRVDTLVLIPVLPRNTLEAQKRLDMIAFNNWVRSIAIQYGAIVADIGRSIVDTASATLWEMQAQYAEDAGVVRLHPNDLCAKALGAALYRYLPNVSSIGRSSPMDGSNLLANGELSGTTTPTSWNVYGAVSGHTRTARPDGEPGVFYGVTTTDFANITQTVFSGFTVGGRYCFEFEFIGSPSGVSNVYGIANDGTNHVGNKPTSTTTGSVPASGVIRTPDFIVQSGATNITCNMYFQGAGTYKVARPYLRKLS